MAIVSILRSTGSQRPEGSRREAGELGVVGEQVATKYLEDRGYAIVERNYRSGKHEIDIIALDGGQLVMVEVKTRTDIHFGTPEQAVDHRKRGFIIQAANQYVLSHNRSEEVRFDVLSVLLKNGRQEVRHIKDAYNIMNY